MKNNTKYIVLVSLTVALGGFLMGFDASVISGVVKFIEPEFELSKLELGWAVSSLTLTATMAMLFAGHLSDKYGRKRILSISALLYALSAILSALAPSFTFLVIARMIGGLGVGVSLIIAPIYIAEIAPAKLRGTMVSFNQFNIVLGISIAFFTNYLILKYAQSDTSWVKSLKLNEYSWRWMLGLETLPAIIYFFGLHFVPLSPRWLIMKGRDHEALVIMKKAIGSETALNDLESIKLSIKNESNKEKVKIKDVYSPALKTVLSIGIVLAVLQQITGINSVFFYAPMIFEQSGIGADASFSQAIWVGLTNLVFTIIAMLLIDKFGRKPLLIIGLIGITCSMFILSYGFNSATYSLSEQSINQLPKNINKENLIHLAEIVFNTESDFKLAISQSLNTPILETQESEMIKSSINLNSTLILIAILAFVASFAVSLGPVMWVMLSELFPNRIRAVAISFVGTINSIVSFSVQLVFPWELANFGNAITFFIYGLFAAIGLLFIIKNVPETKGKSLEELEKILIK